MALVPVDTASPPPSPPGSHVSSMASGGVDLSKALMTSAVDLSKVLTPRSSPAQFATRAGPVACTGPLAKVGAGSATATAASASGLPAAVGTRGELVDATARTTLPSAVTQLLSVPMPGPVRAVAELGPEWRPAELVVAHWTQLSVWQDVRHRHRKRVTRINTSSPGNDAKHAIRALLPLPGKTLACGTQHGVVRIVRDRVVVDEWVGHAGAVNTLVALAWGLDGDDTVVSGSDDGTLRVWAGGVCVHVVPDAHDGPVMSLTRLSTGALVSAGFDKVLCLWEQAQGSRAASAPSTPHSFRTAASGSDGGGVALLTDRDAPEPAGEGAGAGGGAGAGAGHSHDCRLARVFVLRGHTDVATDVCEVAPGIIGSTSEDKTVRLWKAVSGELWETLTHHVGAVTAIAGIPGGGTTPLLVTASDDHMLRVWLKGGHKDGWHLATVRGMKGRMAAAALTTLYDGVIVCGSSADCVTVWRL